MSDTSEIFRKMADCPEIQDEWGKRRYLIRIGDLYYDPIEKGICRVSPFQAHDWNSISKGAIYLPRQDQLWDKLSEDQMYSLERPAKWKVRWCFCVGGDIGKQQFFYGKSAEQALIQGVMSELHSKRWVDGGWVKK